MSTEERVQVTGTEDEFRTRVLVAARECFLEYPGSERIHTLIAQRAGVSRPTVYKYVGDLEAIRRALVAQEALTYVEALGPAFARKLPLREHFRELVVFTVDYLRGNELFQTLLRIMPEEFARDLTIGLAPLLEQGTRVAAPMLARLHPNSGGSGVPVELVLEWGVRISLSLVITPSPFSALDTAEAVRAHVDALFDIVGVPAPVR